MRRVRRTDDTRVPTFAERWNGPDYTPGEFVQDRAEPIGASGTAFTGLAGRAEQLAEAVGGLVAPKWTGPAATLYGDYRTAVRNHLTSTAGALRAAAQACTRQQPELADAWTDATHAAKTCNEARRLRTAAMKTLDELMDAAPSEADRTPAQREAFARNAQRFETADTQLKQGLAEALAAWHRARTALDGLIAGLDGPDHTLSTLVPPRVPDGSTIADPTERDMFNAFVRTMWAVAAGSGDTPGAREAKVAWDRAMADDPTGATAKALLADKTGVLSPAELDWLLDHVDETDLATVLGAFNPKADRGLYNALAEKAGLETLSRLADTDPNHYWHPVTGQPFTWGDIGATPGTVPSADLGLLRQNSDQQNCFWLASLAAMQHVDPAYLTNHVRANANGTYTVTLFRDGAPVEVTVTPEVPYAVDGTGKVTGPAYVDGPANVYQLYQKAMAQAQGELQPQPGVGYAGTSTGYPAYYMPVVTGQLTDHRFSAHVEPTMVQQALAAHKPIVVATPDPQKDLAAGLGTGVYDPKRTPHLIAGHAYYVTSIDTSGASPTITLVNPWGRDSTTDGTVTLSWDEFQQRTDRTDIGR